MLQQSLHNFHLHFAPLHALVHLCIMSYDRLILFIHWIMKNLFFRKFYAACPLTCSLPEITCTLSSREKCLLWWICRKTFDDVSLTTYVLSHKLKYEIPLEGRTRLLLRIVALLIVVAPLSVRLINSLSANVLFVKSFINAIFIFRFSSQKKNQ